MEKPKVYFTKEITPESLVNIYDKYGFFQFHHSVRSASIGFILAAFIAGYRPDIRPTRQEKPIAIMTVKKFGTVATSAIYVEYSPSEDENRATAYAIR